MTILVTGAGGFLAKELIPRLSKRGHTIYGLYHKPPEPKISPGCKILVGDILKPNLGLQKVPPDIEAIYHLAAIHRLGQDKDGSIWETNVVGTQNILEFCAKHGIPHLYFTSTAYTQGRNIYEQSKALGETIVKKSGIPEVTIFKPSVVMGTEKHFYPGHFSQFVAVLIKIHQRAELVRRKLEGALRLPIIEPVFRMRANPDGRLNLVPIDAVADAMASIEKTGTYWLTNPKPPTMQELVEWVGEFIMVKIRIEPHFKSSPIEAIFEKMASAFIPYLWGDNFKSDLRDCPPITREFIHKTIKRSFS